MKESQIISLREIIDILLKQKWIIIIFTIACMLVSGLYSFLVLQPTYETYSIVRMQSSASSTDENSTTDIQTFEESLKSSSTLNALITKNNLDRKEYSINSIRGMFRLEVVPNNNIMKIIVRGQDPQKISRMANMLAYELGIRIEITDRTKEILEAQKKLDDLVDQIEMTKAQLTEAQKQISKTPEKQSTTQSLGQNDLLRDITQESSGINAKEAAGLTMENESINPTYTELQSKIAQASIDLISLQSAEKNQKKKIEENQSRINEIEQISNNDKLDANKSIRILDGTNALFISPSIQPDTPIAPNKIMNIIIAAVVGVAISLMVVFLRQYLKENPRSGVNV
ncbi:Wzz/FepE/Etk N-terminal domain-containing protein [Cohnella caldifontis]|uniref:Wzz/FepE/Etk N-terminal domain-containing protein n=1 Tax=Cohnella caldifontis TaxID=3027471 RepID=UPI0023EDD419|nr:Wzz/FepE/Etk N-terminal domain-containing protein [Cohnella sp. YIM B05605]